jgi:hypothetical protein
MNAIRENWSESKPYRVLLVLAILYALFRLAVLIYLFTDALRTAAITEGTLVSADLQQSYIPAAQHFNAREDIYLKGSLENLKLHFPYSPAFAFLYGPILLLPIQVLVPLMLVIHIVAYWLLYGWWDRIFRQNKLQKAEQLWAWALPMFLLFSVFWDDVGLLNIYLIVALFATFAVDAVLQEKLTWASFWLGAIILPAKPHWAFALAIPLFLGRYRFFFKLLLGTTVAYLAVMGLTIVGGGADYVIRQYQDYIGFLSRLSRDFPWWGPDKPFFGYNHSVKQIVVYYLGVTPENLQFATIVKLILLIPLGLVGLKFLRNPIGKAGKDAPETALALTFALYLGGFIWLDMVWEISLGLVIFVFLLSTIEQKTTKLLIWILFAPYALLDIWRLISYLSFGNDILYQGTYVLTDPFIYVPWIMVILLMFYGLLLQGLAKQNSSWKQ